VVDHAVDGYGPVLGAINEVEEVEEAVCTGGGPRPTERTYYVSRQLLELRRAMAPLSEMLDRLTSETPTSTSERVRRRFREQRAHLQHLVEGADGLGSMSNMLQAYLTEVSVRQNDDMRRIGLGGDLGGPNPAGRAGHGGRDRHARMPAPVQVGRRWVVERTHAWATRTASCAGAPSAAGSWSSSGWRWPAP
jgi:CorA-like Mg2+ transporter protein